MNTELLKSIQQAKRSKMHEGQEIVADTKINNGHTGSDPESLLKDLRGRFDKEMLDEFVSASRQSVFNAIISPFGLAKVLFQDKTGGNVTTLHNAKLNVFATREDAERYNRPFVRCNFDQKNDIFKEARARYKEQARNGELRDVYNSHRSLSEHEIIVDSQGQARLRQGFDVEHINSCKEIHDRTDIKLFMDEKAACDMANCPENLGATIPSLNRAKKNANPQKWCNTTDSSGKTNISKYEMNSDESFAAINKAQKTIDGTVNAYKKSYYQKHIAQTSMTEGTKMGIQQAVSLVLYELADAIYSETVDVYRKGFLLGESILKVLQNRLTRVCKAVIAKWKQVLYCFAQGAVSGFFSNLITTFINMYITTARNIVKIIREGFYSLEKAVRVIMFKPNNLTTIEAAHEATKIVAAGISIGVGVLLEETIQKLVMTVPLLIPLAGFIGTSCSALLTSIIGILAVYSLDKLDIFNAIKEEKHAFVIGELEKKTVDSINRIEEIVEKLEPNKIDNVLKYPSLSVVR